MKRLVFGTFAFALCLVFAFLGSEASAGIITLKAADVGPVFFIDPASPEAAAGFVVGETLRMVATFNDTTSDSDATIGVATYSDPNATLKLIGNTSGAMLPYFGGLEFKFDDNKNFEIDGLVPASAGVSPVLQNDIDLDTLLGTAFFSDVDDLSAVLSDLASNPFPNNTTSIASTGFFDGSGSVDGMKFGPAPASVQFSTQPIPEPSTLVLFAIGVLGILGLGYRQRKKAA